MRAPLLIVGQGLAGTVLGWELERAGIPFAIADAGPAGAASIAAAGILNPITGRRLVKSWRVEALLPLARETYRRIEATLGVPLWRELRIRRLFANERERRVLAEKQTRGELAPFVESADDAGFWVRGAARVDLLALLAASRARWKAQGVLLERALDPVEELARASQVIDCTGMAATRRAPFAFVPWEFSKGELLGLSVSGLDPEVGLNRRHWILPTTEGRALCGATHEPGIRETTPTAAARATLEASARELLGREFAVVGHRAGVRVNSPDKRPVVGLHPEIPGLGLINALGAKGALVAPFLAQQWIEHLTRGASFDPEIDVRRFR